MKNNILSENLKRMSYVMNYDSSKTSKENYNKKQNLVFEEKLKNFLISKIEEEFSKKYGNTKKEILSEAVAPANVWSDLYTKLKASVPPVGKIKVSFGSGPEKTIIVSGYDKRQLVFFDNGVVKWWNGNQYSKGGKWLFTGEYVKNGKLSGSWLLNDKGQKISLKEALGYPSKNFGSDISSGSATKWDRNSQGDEGYWKVLFDQLKAGGINPKWDVANDPVKSTFMYWGPWVIHKNLSRDGGWPVSCTGSDGKIWLFRFKGGKYAGQPANNIILESKFIASTFSLGEWGKLSGAVGGPQFNNLMSKKPKPAEPTAQDLQVAKQVFNELAKAFDGGGTYEDDAVVAFNKIKNKPQLTELNRLVKARGEFPNVYEWLKDEMSDYDYNQYRAIWDRLKKIDSNVQAPPVNYAMVAAGVVGTVVGAKALDKGVELASKAIDQLKNLTIGDIMEGFRKFLSGVTGGIVQLLINVFGGPLGAAINMFAWGSVLIWDIYLWVQGKPNWWNLIVDVFNVATMGVAMKALAPANAVASTAAQKGLPALMTTLKTKFPTVAGYLKGFLSGLSTFARKCTEQVTKAIGWLSSKLPFFKATWDKFNNVVAKIGGLVKSIDDALTNAFGGAAFTASKNAIVNRLGAFSPTFATFLKSPKGIQMMEGLTVQEAKFIDDQIAGPLRGKTMEYAQQQICKSGTPKQCAIFKAANETAKNTINVSKAGVSGTDVNKMRKDNTLVQTQKMDIAGQHLSDVKKASGADEEKKS